MKIGEVLTRARKKFWWRWLIYHHFFMWKVQMSLQIPHFVPPWFLHNNYCTAQYHLFCNQYLDMKNMRLEKKTGCIYSIYIIQCSFIAPLTSNIITLAIDRPNYLVVESWPFTLISKSLLLNCKTNPVFKSW